RGIIANIDADEDVILEDAKEVVVEKTDDVKESTDVQGMQAESVGERKPRKGQNQIKIGQKIGSVSKPRTVKSSSSQESKKNEQNTT
nr:hypothetical protein [Tanacetum cinerariifolium]GFA64616.1 hypothetical protein [Tanacetum cinerariifolium]